MKRILASLAVLAVLATGAFAQTSDPYATGNNTNNNASTNTTNTMTSPTNTNTDVNTTTDATTTTEATTTTDSNNLPATASPLPLLSLSGIGMIATGAWLLRRSRHA